MGNTEGTERHRGHGAFKSLWALRDSLWAVSEGRDDALQLLQQAHIFVVRANPKPQHGVPSQQTKCTMAAANSHRVNRLAFADLFEIQAVSSGINLPQLVGVVGAALDVLGQRLV